MLTHYISYHQLCTRLVVTVIDLMQSRSVSMDGRLLTTCNEVFEAACLSGATRLKHPTHLSSMLNIREEDDQRTRQRTETIMEDLRLVSNCSFTFIHSSVVL